MAFQIPRPPTAFSKQPTGKSSARVKDENYLDFIRSLPCLITGSYPVEAAHISFPSPMHGKLGRGMSRKESDRWTLPMCQNAHARSHSMNEKAYWAEVGIDPCVVALALWGVYPDRELAILILNEHRLRANPKKI